MTTRLLIFGALMSTSTLSNADSFYVGANIGVSMIDDTANSSLIAACEPNCFPDQLSINGLAFDSNETAWGAFVGWDATGWLALEIAYTDLGNTGQEAPFGFFGQVPTIGIAANPGIAVNPALVSGFSAFGGPAFDLSQNGVALNIEEWSISAKFKKSLFSQFSATWSIGISRADFESQGSLTIPVIVGFNPTVVDIVTWPYASPESETGFTWGFGLAWKWNERVSIDLGYRKHETRVVDVETASLSISFRL